MLKYKFRLSSGDIFSIPAKNPAEAWRGAVEFLIAENQIDTLFRLEALF